MRPGRTAAALALVGLVVPAGASAQATERVSVGSLVRGYPASLQVVVASPAEYDRDPGRSPSVSSGSWTGPRYVSDRGGLGSVATVDWSVTLDDDPAAPRAAADDALVQGWPVVAESPVGIPHVVAGRQVGAISGYRLITRAPGQDAAAHDAAVAFPLGGGLVARVHVGLLIPSGDSAGGAIGFGSYWVESAAGRVAPSAWNRAQADAALSGVRLEGSLPARRVELEQDGRTVSARVLDAFGGPVRGARVALERRRGRSWAPLRSASTGADGSVRFPVGALRGATLRATAAFGPATVRSGPLRVAATAERADAYIVVLKESVQRPALVSREQGRRGGFTPLRTFGSALKGYAAELTATQRRRLARDPSVRGLVPDRELGNPETLPTLTQPVSFPPQPPQEVPLGVRRVGATASPSARIDGADERVPVDVAVIDTGIEAHHPDLNVVGGKNCAGGATYNTPDNGHGTHVAGIVGAKDNGIGVVGVAPGARIWSVRVLEETGRGKWSWVICGLDFVTSRSPAKGGPIKVANLSLGAPAGSVPCDSQHAWIDPVHLAVCRAVASGVTVVASAGNDARDLGRYIPASYPEVIAVPGLGDYDGIPGGGARDDAVATGAACRQRDGDTLVGAEVYYGPGGVAYQKDDDLLTVWNWPSAAHAAHSLAAPGACVLSTWPGRSYRKESGTSMAAPHVAGAAALYLWKNPGKTPQEVLSHLRETAEPAVERTAGKPFVVQNHFDPADRHDEPVLRVSGY